MANKKPRRVSKQDWLSAALESLQIGGVENIRIEHLAAKLKISKSGFYWHFQDRQGLLEQLLRYWAHEYTEVITSNPQLWRGDPIKRLDQSMKMIRAHELAKYDLAVRAWAMSDPLAAEAVKNVTNSRLEFIRAAFSDLGFKGDQLEMRSMLFVCYHTWESSVFEGISERKLAKLQKLRLELLVGGSISLTR